MRKKVWTKCTAEEWRYITSRHQTRAPGGLSRRVGQETLLLHDEPRPLSSVPRQRDMARHS